MNCYKTVFSKKRVRSASVFFGLALAALLTSGPASSRSMYEPIGITAPDESVVPGDTVPLGIELEGPSPIQIYSDPPGAVSYSGDMTSSSGEVDVDTDPNTPSGPVTIYVATDGSQVVSTTITAQQ